jgi:predicted NBD/HSP70 family sugar kinase
MKMPANHSMKCILGIDLGGTSLRVARVDALGGAFLRIPTPGRAEAEATMVSAIRKIASGWEVHYTGLSRAPGIDTQGCVVDWPSRPEWNGLELIPWLLSAAGSAVDSADDGACAALWEHRSRVDTSRNAVTACVSIGTGLAVGIMAGDELIATGDGSDTLSHQQFGNLDAPCSCGKRGCLQTALSVRGLEEMLATGRSATLREAFHDFVFALRERFNVNLVAITGGGAERFGSEFLAQTLTSPAPAGIAVEISQAPALSSLGGALLLAAGHDPTGLWTEEVKSFIRRQNNHAAEYETCIDLPQSPEAMGSGLCEVAGN